MQNYQIKGAQLCKGEKFNLAFLFSAIVWRSEKHHWYLLKIARSKSCGMSPSDRKLSLTANKKGQNQGLWNLLKARQSEKIQVLEIC